MELAAAWLLFILVTLAFPRRPIRLAGPDLRSLIVAQTATGAQAATGSSAAYRQPLPDPREAFVAQFAAQRAALRAHMALAEAGARLQSERDGPELRAMLERLKAEWVRGTEAAQAELLPRGPLRLHWPQDPEVRAWAMDWLGDHLAALIAARTRLDRDHVLMTGLLKTCGTGFVVWLEQETDRTRGFLGIARPPAAVRIVQRRIEIAPSEILTPKPKTAPPPDLNRAAELRRIATSRVIPHLIHVTPMTHLPMILRQGLVSPKGLGRGTSDQVATWISFPDAAAFHRARSRDPATDWVVLILARHILWTESCLFGGEGKSAPEDLEALFTPSGRPEVLLPCHTTQASATVFVQDRIPPGLIEALAFETPEALRANQDLIGGREAFSCGRDSGLFGPTPGA